MLGFGGPARGGVAAMTGGEGGSVFGPTRRRNSSRRSTACPRSLGSLAIIRRNNWFNSSGTLGLWALRSGIAARV